MTMTTLEKHSELRAATFCLCSAGITNTHRHARLFRGFCGQNSGSRLCKANALPNESSPSSGKVLRKISDFSFEVKCVLIAD